MVPRCRFVGDDHGHFGTGYRHLVEMMVRSLAFPSREIKAEKPEVDQSLAITSESHFFFICAGPRYLEEQPGNAAALRLGVDLLKCCNDLGDIHLSWLTITDEGRRAPDNSGGSDTFPAFPLAAGWASVSSLCWFPL